MNPIEKILKQESISRMELARRARIPYVTLTTISNGLTGSLQGKTLAKLSEYSKIPQDELSETYQIWRASQAQE